MVGTDIRLGPWPDGINLLDKVDQLRDTQLTDCTNFDIDNTGVLEPRRGLRYRAQDSTAQTKYLLGTVILDGETQPRAMTATYDGSTSFFKFIGNPTTASLDATVGRSGIFRSVVQYQNKIWYVPGVSGSLGASSPASATNTFTTVSDIPYGDDSFILKDRLFVVRKASSELYFSAATAFAPTGPIPAPWAAPNGGVIQVAPGDNNPITKVVVLNNQIVIFKRDSTWILSFTNSPTGDGVLRQVSADQGAIDAITYNNEIYCYNARSVFKFVNGFFQDIGLQLALPNTDTIDATASNPARISVVGKTLIFGTTPSGKNYAMNLDTGAWTRYSFAGDLSIATKTIISRSALGTTIFFGDGTTKLGYLVVSRSDTRRTDQSSDVSYNKPAYMFRTKEYNLDDSETWKRLYSWHLDSSFITAPEGSALTYINGVQNNTTTDVVDLVGSSVSYRFKTTSMAYNSPSAASADATVTGPIVRGIRAVIGAKAPVSV